MRLAILSAALLCSCATTSTGDKLGAAGAQMAVGGGFVATGSITTIGGVIGAGYVISQVPDEAQGALLLPVGAALAVGALELAIGSFAIVQGRDTFAATYDAMTVQTRRSITAADTENRAATDEKLQAARARLVDACAAKVCEGSDAMCVSEMRKAGLLSDDLDEWLGKQGCVDEH